MRISFNQTPITGCADPQSPRRRGRNVDCTPSITGCIFPLRASSNLGIVGQAAIMLAGDPVPHSLKPGSELASGSRPCTGNTRHDSTQRRTRLELATICLEGRCATIALPPRRPESYSATRESQPRMNHERHQASSPKPQAGREDNHSPPWQKRATYPHEEAPRTEPPE